MTAAHLGGAYPSGDANTIMPDVWGYLLTRWPIRRVLDVGCGYGHAMRWFADVGECAVVGLDGDPACVAADPRIIAVDFTKGGFGAAEAFDLAWSSELLEHVDERYLPNLMSAFAQARLAVVTHGEPGQPGHHHVNCRPTSYWVERFAEAGFDYLPEETARLRATDRKRATYGRRTLTVFERRGTFWPVDLRPAQEPGLVGAMRRVRADHPLIVGASVKGPYQEQLRELVRAEWPYVVVETGVQSGISTHAILTAMDELDRGYLYSVEPTNHGGILDVAHPRWQQCRAYSQDILGPIFRQTGPWDIFLHDSDHEVACQTFEYECAWHFVRSGGLILSDDTNWGINGGSAPAHDAWPTFVKRHGLTEFEVGFARGVRKPSSAPSVQPGYGESASRDRAIEQVVARAKVLAATAVAEYGRRRR